MQEEKRISLQVPKEEKEEVKKFGGRWDKERQLWHVPAGQLEAAQAAGGWKLAEQQPEQAQTQEKEQAQERISLQVPKQEKEEVKKFGGRWDKGRQLWHVPADQLEAAQAAWGWKLAGQQPEQAQTQAQAQEKKRGKIPAREDRLYIAATFEEREEAKSLGAMWDRKAKSWFVDQDNKAALERFGADKPEIKQQEPGKDVVEQLAGFLEDHGVAIKGAPVLDGNAHRVALKGARGKELDGTYTAYSDGLPAGIFHNYKTGETHKWISNGRDLTTEERAALAASAADAKLKREQEKAQDQKKAAARAFAIWRASQTWASQKNNSYLASKEVDGGGIKINDKGHLLVPLRDTTGRIHALQTITQEGKFFTKDGQKKGLFHSIDPKQDLKKDRDKVETIVIAEGYATAATVSQATRQPTIVAFDAGNLLPVAENIRKEYPKAKIILAADNDHKDDEQKQNKGLTEAKKAAKAVNGIVVAPRFNAQEKDKGLTDWNDMQAARGKETTAKSINGAITKALNPQKEQAQAKEQEASLSL